MEESSNSEIPLLIRFCIGFATIRAARRGELPLTHAK